MTNALWVYKVRPEDELHDAYVLHAIRREESIFRGVGRTNAFIVVKGPLNPANLYPTVKV